MTSDVVGQRYDPEKNQLPYGGAVDIDGRIVWAVTEEEAKAARERIKKALERKMTVKKQKNNNRVSVKLR